MSNKDITDDHGKKIGRMDVNTDGLVVITFSDDVTGFDYKDYFKGTFKVWGQAFAKDDSTSGTITFPGHGNSFTLKKKSDIRIDKNVDSKIIVEDGRTYFKYTIRVDSTNGTAGETVTINDNITNLWNVTGQFDQASFKLTKMARTRKSRRTILKLSPSRMEQATSQSKDLRHFRRVRTIR